MGCAGIEEAARRAQPAGDGDPLAGLEARRGPDPHGRVRGPGRRLVGARRVCEGRGLAGTALARPIAGGAAIAGRGRLRCPLGIDEGAAAAGDRRVDRARDAIDRAVVDAGPRSRAGAAADGDRHGERDGAG
jgi:hypothetical protein